MRRLTLLILSSLLISHGTAHAASLGSTAAEFRSQFGPTSFEEQLVRTSTLRWKPLRTRENMLTVAKASALEVNLLDGHGCAVAIWCERRVNNSDVARLARWFFGQQYHASDFRKPWREYLITRIYKLRDGGTVLVNEHGKQNVIVIGSRAYWQNTDVFNGEAAKVRPPTSEI
jgi:hypothetical protein